MLAAGVGTASASPEGVWELDSRDTRLRIELCGDGTQICGSLAWLSDADYNDQYLPYLNTPVTNGVKQIGPNRWKGAMRLLGRDITGTITQRSEDQMSLTACAFLVVCKTYQMFKVGE
jgi:uncharacterized protein (DUF2147 family)